MCKEIYVAVNLKIYIFIFIFIMFLYSLYVKWCRTIDICSYTCICVHIIWIHISYNMYTCMTWINIIYSKSREDKTYHGKDGKIGENTILSPSKLICFKLFLARKTNYSLSYTPQGVLGQGKKPSSKKHI